MLKRLLWRQFLHKRCNVCNTYLNVQILVCVNWFRHVLARACAIAWFSWQRQKMLKSVCQLYRDSFRYRFNQWFWASISPGSICCGKIPLHSHFSIILFKLLLMKILLFISIFYCLCEYAVRCNYWLLIIFSSFILYVEMRL